MAKGFIQLKSKMDDITVARDENLKRAGKEIARAMIGGDRAAVTSDIDKLLVQFSAEEKFIIMKYAFLECI